MGAPSVCPNEYCGYRGGGGGVMIDWKAVGQRITELRQERGVSKDELVELVHDSASRRVWRGPKWHPSSLLVLEGGKGSILPCDILTDVAQALGTSEAFLLFGVHLDDQSQTEGKEVVLVDREKLEELRKWIGELDGRLARIALMGLLDAIEDGDMSLRLFEEIKEITMSYAD